MWSSSRHRTHSLINYAANFLAIKYEHIKKLTARIEQLEEQVNKNSNKPPTSDGLAKTPAFPRKRGGRRGGKIGHKGKTLDLVQTPDLSIPLLPENVFAVSL